MTTVAVCQVPLAIGEVAGNRAAARAAVTEAAGRGARLVVLPELCDTGYVFASADEARAMAAPLTGNPTLREWQALAARHAIVIAGGFCELASDGRICNSAALVDGSGILAVYRKAHLWDAERLIFTPGNEPPVVADLPFGRVGLMICYDLEFPEWVRLAALRGADVIAAPVNWPATPTPAGEHPGEIIRAQASASVNRLFLAVADRCAAERGVTWVGGTVILAPDGYPLAGPVAADRGCVLTAECDLAAARDKSVSPHNDVLADRRPALYGPVLAEPARAMPGPAAAWVTPGPAAARVTPGPAAARVTPGPAAPGDLPLDLLEARSHMNKR